MQIKYSVLLGIVALVAAIFALSHWLFDLNMKGLVMVHTILLVILIGIAHRIRAFRK